MIKNAPIQSLPVYLIDAFNCELVDEEALLQFGQQMGLGKGIIRRFKKLILLQQDKVQ